jgi:hypothetical protein
MEKTQLLAVLASERDKLERIIDAVGMHKMDEGGVSGSYSTRDVVAHITAYEVALVTWLKEAKAGRVYVDPVLDQPDLDARNAIVHEASKDRSANEIVTSFRTTCDQLEECIRLLTDDELTNADATAWFIVPRWERKQTVKCIANDCMSITNSTSRTSSVGRRARPGLGGW